MKISRCTSWFSLSILKSHSYLAINITVIKRKTLYLRYREHDSIRVISDSFETIRKNERGREIPRLGKYIRRHLRHRVACRILLARIACVKEGKRICLVVSNAEEIDIMPCEENVEMIKINLGIGNQVGTYDIVH